MKIRLPVIIVSLFLIVILAGCLSDSTDRYEITIFTEEPPTEELQITVNNILENNELNYGIVTWSKDPPSRIDKFPTFIVRSHKGTFETSDIKEFEANIESL